MKDRIDTKGLTWRNAVTKTTFALEMELTIGAAKENSIAPQIARNMHKVKMELCVQRIIGDKLHF